MNLKRTKYEFIYTYIHIRTHIAIPAIQSRHAIGLLAPTAVEYLPVLQEEHEEEEKDSENFPASHSKQATSP